MAGVIWYTYTLNILDHLARKTYVIGHSSLVSFLRVWATVAKFRVLSEGTVSWLGAFRITLSWDFTSAVTPSTIGDTYGNICDDKRRT